MLWLIDNYDSFTFNIVHYLRELAVDPKIVKSDKVDFTLFSEDECQGVIISPGPGKPSEAEASIELVRKYSGKLPILGICLGHEVIGEVFGAQVVHARDVMHGKVSTIYHDGRGVFRGLPNPVDVCRYHSLIIDPISLPETLEVSAWTVDANGNPDEIMGVRHRTNLTEGIQFHPEAILTQHGHKMLGNFLNCCGFDTGV